MKNRDSLQMAKLKQAVLPILEKSDIYVNAIFKENPLYSGNPVRVIKFKLPQKSRSSERDFFEKIDKVYLPLSPRDN